MEETNMGFGRGMLPATLGLFFVVGLLRALWGERRDTWAAVVLLVALPLVALGGPNLKHAYFLFPWIALLATGGLKVSCEAVAAWTRPRLAAWMLVLVAAASLHLELTHLFRTLPKSEDLRFMVGIARSTSETVVGHLGDRTHVFLVGVLGLDVVSLNVREAAAAAERMPPEVHWWSDSMDPTIAGFLSADTKSMVVIQSGETPRILADPELLACFDRRVVHPGGFVHSVYLRRAGCVWEPPRSLQP
jgi:hypothetical protein